MAFLDEFSKRDFVMMGSAVCLGGVTLLAMKKYLQKHRPQSAPVYHRAMTAANESCPSTHQQARQSPYPRHPSVQRFPVPDDKVHWEVPFPAYRPVVFTAVSVASKPGWADPDYATERGFSAPKWNSLEGNTNRRSHTGAYRVVDNLPRNPVGRTGICHRGLLGKWGPNHAADPIVTRWKRTEDGSIVTHPVSRMPVLQLVLIQRKDTGQWALPGGMVDAGDNVSITLRKEFAEEAMNTLESSSRDAEATMAKLDQHFRNGFEVFRGYVDDPRNTDNAWMETVAVCFHDASGQGLGKFKLHAGDDAGQVRWADLDGNLQLYASHICFVRKVAEHFQCHW